MAIEALRRTIISQQERLDIAEDFLGINDSDETHNRDEDRTNKERAHYNAFETALIKADVKDLEDCLYR